jgi:predicted MFS family arabinose efflux permease
MSLPPASSTASLSPNSTAPLSVGQLLFCGAMVVTLAMGIRHGFGLWLQPMCMERGWSRETYSLAMAIQNLVWGAAGPLVGWWADRRGATRPLLLGALLYPLGLLGMSMATAPWSLMLSMGVLIGAAQSCTTYAVIYGAIGRHVPADRRSWAMGVTAAAGSFGQFLMVPLASTLIAQLGWQHALWGLAASALLIAPLGWQLLADRPSPVRPAAPGAARTGEPTNAKDALHEALTHPSYLLLTAGYFVCGFQLAFIGVHLPSYLRDHQLPATVATTALALIGLFNIFGSYSVGWLGQRWPKAWVLSGIYGLRALVMLAFISQPPSGLSVSLFACAMGFLWLSTVPPTNGIVAQMLGVRFLSMLGALVFLSHQLGSFAGVWLAGRLYDATGSYQVVWWIAIGLSLMAAALNLPVKETLPPKGRLAVAT